MAALHLYSPWTPQQTYFFQSTGGYSFAVLADEQPATITGGFAKIQVIDRPRRKGFTQPVGYDPLSMDVPIRFDCTVRSSQPSGAYTAADLERDVQILEGMTGRGKFVSTDGTFHAAVGDPPVVQLWGNNRSDQSDLVPQTAQDLSWIITGLSYGTPLRRTDGARVLQPMVVSLSEWVKPPSSKKSARVPYVIYRATLSLDTVAKLVRHYTSHHTAAAYRKVVGYNRDHGAKYKSYNQKLKPDTAVYIPRDL